MAARAHSPPPLARGCNASVKHHGNWARRNDRGGNHQPREHDSSRGTRARRAVIRSNALSTAPLRGVTSQAPRRVCRADAIGAVTALTTWITTSACGQRRLGAPLTNRGTMAHRMNRRGFRATAPTTFERRVERSGAAECAIRVRFRQGLGQFFDPVNNFCSWAYRLSE
jgi:hypothetical protein